MIDLNTLSITLSSISIVGTAINIYINKKNIKTLDNIKESIEENNSEPYPIADTVDEINERTQFNTEMYQSMSREVWFEQESEEKPLTKDDQRNILLMANILKKKQEEN